MGKKKTTYRQDTYSKPELAGYLTGLAGQNIIYNIVNTGLLFYFQSVIFIPAMAYSTILAIARVWDAINDPMMGTIVDKTRTKWGKCKPYLMFAPPVIMAATLLPFANQIYSESAPTINKILIVGWAAVSYIFWGMAYTVGDVTLWGVTSLMTRDENDRAKVLSLARIFAAFGAIGLAFSFIADPMKQIFLDKGYDPDRALQYAYILTAIILTVFASILFEFAGLSVHERVNQTTESHTMKENFKTMWSCLPFRQLLISGVLRSPTGLLSAVAMPLVIYYYFNNDVVGTLLPEGGGVNIGMVLRVLILLTGVMGGMLISSGVTPGFTKKIEKKKLYNIYCIFGAIPYALAYIIYKLAGGNLMSWPMTIIIGLVFFAASWSMGGLNVLQSVMIADCVDYEEYNNGVRPDGVFFAGQSFITKLSSGISALIMGFGYTVVGFSGDNMAKLAEDLRNGASFMTYNGGKYAAAMFFLVSIPSAIGVLLSALPTLKYALTDKEHTRILDELNEKRHSEKAE